MRLSDKSMFVVIITLALTLTFNNTAKPPASACFRFCVCKTSETLQLLGMSSLAGIDINLSGRALSIHPLYLFAGLFSG